MNADLAHGPTNSRTTGKGNLFVISFARHPHRHSGPPKGDDAKIDQIQIRSTASNVSTPQTAKSPQRREPTGSHVLVHWTPLQRRKLLRSAHAYSSAQATLTKVSKTIPPKAEINAEGLATLNSDTSRPFDKPIPAASPVIGD